MATSPEVVDYVFKNYYGLMTFAESTAYRTLLAEEQAQHSSSEMLKRKLRENFSAKEPAVIAWLSLGTVGFQQAVAERILREHDEVILNRCTKCGALARTPAAKQCPNSFHDWHDVA